MPDWWVGVEYGANFFRGFESPSAGSGTTSATGKTSSANGD